MITSVAGHNPAATKKKEDFQDGGTPISVTIHEKG
jgi:hypothetical protein